MSKVIKPLFSIVTVVKNDAYGLVQTIESVIEQNLSDYEYIIIGGESEDETNSIITKYQKHIDKSIPANLPVHIATQTEVSEWFSLA